MKSTASISATSGGAATAGLGRFALGSATDGSAEFGVVAGDGFVGAAMAVFDGVENVGVLGGSSVFGTAGSAAFVGGEFVVAVLAFAALAVGAGIGVAGFVGKLGGELVDGRPGRVVFEPSSDGAAEVAGGFGLARAAGGGRIVSTASAPPITTGPVTLGGVVNVEAVPEALGASGCAGTIGLSGAGVAAVSGAAGASVAGREELGVGCNVVAGGTIRTEVVPVTFDEFGVDPRTSGAVGGIAVVTNGFGVLFVFAPVVVELFDSVGVDVVAVGVGRRISNCDPPRKVPLVVVLVFAPAAAGVVLPFDGLLFVELPFDELPTRNCIVDSPIACVGIVAPPAVVLGIGSTRFAAVLGGGVNNGEIGVGAATCVCAGLYLGSVAPGWAGPDRCGGALGNIAPYGDGATSRGIV